MNTVVKPVKQEGARSSETRSLMTKQDVAEQLQVSVRSVERMVQQNKLRRVKLGRHVRFDPSDVEALIQGNRD